MASPQSTTTTKICSMCRKELPTEAFRSNAARRDGLHSSCRLCEKARLRGDSAALERKQARDRAREELRAPRRRTGRRESRKDPLHARVRRKLQRAAQAGKVVRPDACSQCDAVGPVEGHHADYGRPLDVEWLCPACHGQRHRKYPIDGRGDGDDA